MVQFKDCMSLASVGNLRIVEFRSVQALARSDTKPTSNGIVFDFEHLTSSTGILVKDLLG
jgi:hypothetical protein